MLRSDASAAPAQVGPDDTCVSKQFASSPVPSGLDPAKTDCVVVESVALTSNDNSTSEVFPSVTELPTLSGVPTTLKNPENSEENPRTSRKVMYQFLRTKFLSPSLVPALKPLK